MKKGKPVFSVLIAYTLVVFAGANAAVLPKTAEIVPAETVFLADISDFNQFRARFEKSSIYKLYKDPAMAAFVENFTNNINEKLSKGEDSIFSGKGGIFDINGLPEGRLAFAFVSADNASSQQEPTFVLISQWGGKFDKIKEKVEKIILKSIEKGAQRSIEQYRDVNLIILTTEKAPVKVSDWENYRPDDDNMPLTKTVQPPPDKDIYCFIDDCLIMGNDVETAKFVVAHIKGAGGSTLAADSDYASVMAETGPYRDISLYLNFKQFLKRMVAEDKTGQDSMEMSNLGLNGLVGLGCSLGVNTEEKGNLYGKAFLKTTGMRKGILKMLEVRSEPVKAPKFVPASAYSVSFFNIDIKRAYDEFCSVMYGFNPASAAALQMPLVEGGANGEPAITLRKDIIEYLGSQIVVSQSINKPFETGVAPTETMIAITINNRVDLEKSLSLVHKRLIVPLNPEPTRELLGHTIYLLGPMGIPIFGGAVPMEVPLPGPKAAPKAPRLAFTITDTHLIMGQEPAVERAIRTLAGADTIGSSEWFNTAKSAVPSVVGLAGLENTAASGELLWWMLKQNAKTRRAELGMGPAAAVLAGPGFWDFGDYGLLPEFDSVRKYFGYSAFYGVSRPDGFLFEFKYVNPR